MNQAVVFVEHLGEGIVRVRVDDPKTRNGITEQLLDEMPSVLAELRADTQVKVVVLAGAPDVFCGGGTLDMVRDVAEGRLVPRDAQLNEAIVSFPAPVIAALEGVAVGAGLAMALCADITVAAETRRYGFNFMSLGFTPGMGTTGLVPALVGHQFASEMLLTGAFYTGRDLRGRGLFTHVVPDEHVMEYALDLARRIAEKPALALRLLKADLAQTRVAQFRQALSREHEMHRQCFAQDEIQATIRENFPDWAAVSTRGSE